MRRADARVGQPEFTQLAEIHVQRARNIVELIHEGNLSRQKRIFHVLAELGCARRGSMKL